MFGSRWQGGARKGKGRNTGRRGLGPLGPPTNCICPECGAISPHIPGTPCFQQTCPRCGSPMARQFEKEGQGE
ncbi:MAG TPA: hypothetical protein DCR97_06785 [Deltaproteobacteria bacterium]|nr:hypothetical protein [Deltaproteobacteria bacterium]